jgi:SAM-dependent methyltransferase
VRSCNVCGGKELKTFSDEIFVCTECKAGTSIHRHPNVEDQDYFQESYLPNYLSAQPQSDSEKQYYLNLINHYVKRDKIRHLDVGCALGSTMRQAQNLGWETAGIDLSPFAAKWVQDNLGLKTWCGTVEQSELPAGAFDVITLLDVIEHTYDPLTMLRGCLRVLAPGGAVLIVTPNFSSISVKLRGTSAYGIWPIHHLTYFGPKGIRTAFKMTGYETMDVRTRDLYPENLARILKRNPSNLKAQFGAGGGSSMRQLANRVFNHLHYGDKLVAIARRPLN